MKGYGRVFVGLWLFLLAVAVSWAQVPSQVFFFNPAWDYFAGDRKEAVSYKELLTIFRHQPKGYRVLGIGAAAEGEQPGWVIFAGRTSNPKVHLLPSMGLPPEEFPWLELGVCNPAEGLKRRLKNEQDIQRFVADQLRRAGYIKWAVLYIRGRFTYVSYLPRPDTDKRKIGTSGEWEMVGVYCPDYATQFLASRPGSPLILCGMRQETEEGGLVLTADATEAEVLIYPVEEYHLWQSDLTIAAARLKMKLEARIQNVGRLAAKEVKVELRSSQGKLLEEQVIPVLAGKDQVIVSFERPPEPYGKRLVLVVDPQQAVRELREDNNFLWFAPHRKR